MNVEAIVKSMLFIIVLFIVMFIYQLIISKLSQTSTKKIWVGFGAFSIFSLLYLESNILYIITTDPVYFENLFNLIKLFWWLSLNYLVLQIIDYWIWNKFFLSKGIIISRILKDLVSLTIMILTIAAIVHFVYDSSVFGIFTASGVMAIILGYSAQATLSDIFAGLGLNTSKEFSEGDWIKVSDSFGKVIEISWRYVKLITKDQNYLSIPNSVISKLPIINISQPTPVRGIRVGFFLVDGISPDRFKKILVNSALQSTKVLKDPPPKAFLSIFLNAVNNYTEYQLSYYTKEIDESIVNDEIFSMVWYACRREQIKILAKEIVPKPEDLSKSIIEKFLKNTDLFNSLNKEEISNLAAGAICHHYGPPERILEQNQSNSSLFLIYSGSVDVYFTKDTPNPVYIATIKSNQYFGEMSLLTGEAVSATILTKEDSIIIEINHDTMANLFSKRPDFMEKISQVVIQRKQSNIDIQASMNQQKKAVKDNLVGMLVKKIKTFFKFSSEK